MKLTSDQINDIIFQRKEGKTIYQIAEEFKVSGATISYHTDNKQKERMSKNAINWYKKQTQKKKKEINKKRYPYIKNYVKSHYQNDPIYRKKFIEYVKKYNKKKRIKALEEGLCPRCLNKRDSKFIQCSKCREKRR